MLIAFDVDRIWKISGFLDSACIKAISIVTRLRYMIASRGLFYV